MPARRNRIKRMFREGTPRIGLFHSLGSPVAAELLGHAGFDLVVIDGEHATNDVPSIRDQLVALDAAGLPAMVRVVQGDAAVIKQVMDAGAQSLLVPMVEAADEAATLVRAMRFPPEGIRGVAGGTRAGLFGLDPDYLATANGEACLSIQVESRTALENLDELLGVEGVDCLFIGPSDLAAGMGHLGNPAHPDVQAAIGDALNRIRGAARTAGIYASAPEQARAYVSMGANFVVGGTDIGVLAKAAKGLAESLRSALD